MGGLGRGGLGQGSAVQELGAMFPGAERLQQPWGPGSSTLPGAFWPRGSLIALEAIKAFLRNPSCLGSRGTAGRGGRARLPGRKSAAMAPRAQRTPGTRLWELSHCTLLVEETVKRQDNASFGAPVSMRAYPVITEALQKQTAYKQTKNSEEFVQIQLNRNPVLIKLRWK